MVTRLVGLGYVVSFLLLARRPCCSFALHWDIFRAIGAPPHALFGVGDYLVVPPGFARFRPERF